METCYSVQRTYSSTLCEVFRYDMKCHKCRTYYYVYDSQYYYNVWHASICVI